MTTQLIVSPEHVQDGLLPVRHLSFSAIRSFLQSENMFFKRYVRLEFDVKEKPAMLIGKAAHETIERIYQDKSNGITGENYQDIAQAVLTRMLNEARKNAQDRLGIKEIDPEQESTIKDQIEKEAIEWGKTVTEEKAREQLTFAISNYLANLDNSETISTEIMETVQFTDLEGQIMPLPLKGIIDRIERNEIAEEGLRDYKIVAMFSDPNEKNAAYELQAASFYYVFQGLKGYPPKFAIFEEVLKKESGYILKEDPTRRLLQKDLRELCEKHGLGWEKYDKNEDLQNKLILAGVLVKEPSVQKIVIRYEERMDIIETFLEIYKRILNRLGLIALYNVEYGELVNPFDQMNGKDAWKDFTEGIGLGIDTKKRPELANEDSLLDDDFEF